MKKIVFYYSFSSALFIKHSDESTCKILIPKYRENHVTCTILINNFTLDSITFIHFKIC